LAHWHKEAPAQIELDSILRHIQSAEILKFLSYFQPPIGLELLEGWGVNPCPQTLIFE